MSSIWGLPTVPLIKSLASERLEDVIVNIYINPRSLLWGNYRLGVYNRVLSGGSAEEALQLAYTYVRYGPESRQRQERYGSLNSVRGRLPREENKR